MKKSVLRRKQCNEELRVERRKKQAEYKQYREKNPAIWRFEVLGMIKQDYLDMNNQLKD